MDCKEDWKRKEVHYAMRGLTLMITRCRKMALCESLKHRYRPLIILLQVALGSW